MRSSLPLSAPAESKCQVLQLPLRAASDHVAAVSTLRVGFQKRLAPFVKFFKLPRSRNQVVPCVLFVKLSSHKKVSAGAGRGGPQSSLQESSCKKTKTLFPSLACAYKGVISQFMRAQAFAEPPCNKKALRRDMRPTGEAFFILRQVLQAVPAAPLPSSLCSLQSATKRGR